MAKRTNILKEFFLYVKENKVYWIVPIIIVVLILTLLVFFGGTAAAPFIYTLF
jgi:hypothetical protein